MDNIVLKDQDITTVRLSVWEQLRNQLKEQESKLLEIEKERSVDKKIQMIYAELLQIGMSHAQLSPISKSEQIGDYLRKVESSGFTCEYDSHNRLIIKLK